jgi:hypothetical protein
MQDRYNNLTGSEWGGIGTSVFGGVTDYFAKQKEADAIRAQASALRDKGASDVEVAKLMLEAKRLELEAAKAGAGAGNTGGNKTLYIALGIGGVVILGLVIFAVTRKKS